MSDMRSVAFEEAKAAPAPSRKTETPAQRKARLDEAKAARLREQVAIPTNLGSRYQTYGAWSFCERVVPSDSYDLADFHQAPLLWPDDNEPNSPLGVPEESDFPEADLNATATTPPAYQFSAFAHYGGPGVQDQFQIPAVDPSFDQDQWHVYTQIWGPDFRSYYVDGKLVGTTDWSVYDGIERWQLQVEPSQTGGSGSGHAYVKWVWIGTLGS